MNPDKQRIKIAEACGWELICPPGGMFFAYWQNGPIKAEDLPDYLNDLNSMYEARKVLTLSQQENYLLWLGRVVESGLDDLEHDWNVVNATAAQCAEAFLRTIGKWEDET